MRSAHVYWFRIRWNGVFCYFDWFGWILTPRGFLFFIYLLVLSYAWKCGRKMMEPHYTCCVNIHSWINNVYLIIFYQMCLLFFNKWYIHSFSLHLFDVFYHKRCSIRIHVLMTENSNFKHIQQQFHHKMLITFEFWHVLKSFTFPKHKKVNISLWTFPKGNSLFSVIVLTDKPFSCVYSLNISIQYQFFIEILIG